MNDSKFWDDSYVTGAFRDHWDYAVPSQELVSLVAAGVIPPHASVVDMGCGAGRESVFLAECGFDVIGVDISSKALEIAKRRAWDAGVEVDFRQGNFFELPIDDLSIGFVNDRGGFHLVSEKYRPQYVAEVRRVLKPDGIVMIRGASAEEIDENLTPVTEESIDEHFPASEFSRGPVLPIKLVSDAEGTLDGRIVVLRKKHDGQ